MSLTDDTVAGRRLAERTCAEIAEARAEAGYALRRLPTRSSAAKRPLDDLRALTDDLTRIGFD